MNDRREDRTNEKSIEMIGVMTNEERIGRREHRDDRSDDERRDIRYIASSDADVLNVSMIYFVRIYL